MTQRAGPTRNPQIDNAGLRLLIAEAATDNQHLVEPDSRTPPTRFRDQICERFPSLSANASFCHKLARKRY